MGMESVTRDQIIDKTKCIFLCAYTLGEGMKPYVLPIQQLLNSRADWFFSKTGYLTKAKEPSLFYYFPIAGERTDGSCQSQGH